MNKRLALKLVDAEIVDSIEKHGEFADHRAGHSILQEEYHEFEQEIYGDNIHAAVEEAKQVAAMAIKFMVSFGSQQ